MDDLISRQAVLETLDDMDNVLDEDRTIENYKELLKECYEVLPPVRPQEPCEDAISRQAVLDVIKSMSNANPSYWNVCDVVDRKDLIDEVEQLLPVTPQSKTGHCKDCKWWKDSDGTYCRGVHAESKCPINRKEVYEGNGYCYMFEPQERSEKE